MNIIDCPACAGPDNAECETCHGTSEVTQDVYDAFMEKRAQNEATWSLKRAMQELPIENIPGVEQTAIVVTTVDNNIVATIDGEDLSWDDSSNQWV